MKNLRLPLVATLILLSSFNIATASERTKALTCSRKVDLMFGSFEQGDLIYADIYLNTENKFELEVVSETNQILIGAMGEQNTYSSSDLSQSLIAASWKIEGTPVELRLAYFGGVKWMGLVMLPKGFESSNYSLTPGAEIELDCRELNLSALE